MSALQGLNDARRLLHLTIHKLRVSQQLSAVKETMVQHACNLPKLNAGGNIHAGDKALVLACD